MPAQQILKFDVEGQPVICYVTGEHRLWRCDCAYFQRTLQQYGEGFFPHVVVAVETFTTARLTGSRSRIIPEGRVKIAARWVPHCASTILRSAGARVRSNATLASTKSCRLGHPVCKGASGAVEGVGNRNSLLRSCGRHPGHFWPDGRKSGFEHVLCRSRLGCCLHGAPGASTKAGLGAGRPSG